MADRLADLRGLLERGTPRGLVVQAPPGSGKTTLAPPLIADWLARAGGPARVVVAQPRRIAARAAASHLARLLGEPVGATVGYSVRDDVRVSPATRVELVTPGILLRRLQADPELPGVGAVVVDEVHERHAQCDLALAFLLDARATIRPDLWVGAMSATLDAERWARLLGEGGTPASVLAVDAPPHPLAVRWSPPPRGAQALGPVGRDGLVGVRDAFLAHVARTALRALGEAPGDVLVFLPGRRELARVSADLGQVPGADVVQLAGYLPVAAQDRALEPGRRRRVVLATAVAESSLTVPGVRAVVDSCLAREPRADAGSGLTALVTVHESRDRGEQRAGRAARLGPGAVYRCISPLEWSHMSDRSTPEVAHIDLTGFLLQCACWGAPGAAGLRLPDAPPAGPAAAATDRLRALGAVDAGGRATPLGRRLAAMPLEPPLARALALAAPRIGARRAAQAVALLSADVRAANADLASRWRALRRAGPGDPEARAYRQEARRLERAVRELTRSASGSPFGDDDALALVLATAHPEWIAKRRADSAAGAETSRYLCANGVGARLPRGSALEGQEWLAVGALDAGRGEGAIRSAAPLAADEAARAGAALVREDTRAELQGGRVRASRVRRLGAIDLAERPLEPVPREVGAPVVREALRRDGLKLLPWPESARELRERLAFLRRSVGAPWPDVSDEALLADLGWIAPLLRPVARGRPLAAVDTAAGLRTLLPWPEAARLDELAPARLAIPTGARRRVDYSGAQPVMTLRVQEAFGWTDTPRLAGGRVPVLLHLTSPAGRTVAVTADLASFWGDPYRDVRAQLRGRYPRHPWPEDPLAARPTTRAKPRRG